MSEIIITAQHTNNLSKAQLDFNRLTEKVNALREQVANFNSYFQIYSQRISADVFPLLKEQRELLKNLVLTADRMSENPFFKAKERRKIVSTILEMLSMLPEIDDEMIEIYNKHSGLDYIEEKKEAEMEEVAILKMMAEDAFGISFDDRDDLDTVKKVKAYIADYFHSPDAFAKDEAPETPKNEAHNERPKTAKEQAREQKKAEKQAKIDAENKKATKSVRELYMDLVKTFHPDLEQDETERTRKTGIMQRVTAAYEANDLMALLQLQMEFERMDQAQLASLSDEKLQLFNKKLRNQEKELKAELMGIKIEFSELTQLGLKQITSTATLDFWMNQEVKKLKQSTQALKEELAYFSDATSFRIWLKYNA